MTRSKHIKDRGQRNEGELARTFRFSSVQRLDSGHACMILVGIRGRSADMQQALGLVHRLVGLVRWLKTHSVGGDVAHIAARSPAVGVAKKKGEGQTTCPA